MAQFAVKTQNNRSGYFTRNGCLICVVMEHPSQGWIVYMIRQPNAIKGFASAAEAHEFAKNYSNNPTNRSVANKKSKTIDLGRISF